MSAYQVQLSMRLFMPIGIAQKKNNQQTHKKKNAAQWNKMH